MDQITEKEELTVFAVPCSRAFVVAPEKWEGFINQKPNLEIKIQMEETVKKLKVNNLDLKEESKKRIRTKN